MSDELNELGLEADRIDNLLAACEIPMPAEFHLAQIKLMLPPISEAIKKYVIETSGVNPWSDE